MGHEDADLGEQRNLSVRARAGMPNSLTATQKQYKRKMLSQSCSPASLPASSLYIVAYVPCLQNPHSHLKDSPSPFRRCVQGFFILPFLFLLSNCIKVVSCTSPACFLIPAPGPMSSSHTRGWAHHQLPGAPFLTPQKSINFRAAIYRTNTKI